MSKMSELDQAIKELRNCGEALIHVSETLRGLYTGGNQEPVNTGEIRKKEASETEEIQKKEPPQKEEVTPQYTFEDVQKLASQKVHTGHKAQVKELIEKYSSGGHLSDVAQSDYAALMQELENL